jgi:hypothetical protein
MNRAESLLSPLCDDANQIDHGVASGKRVGKVGGGYIAFDLIDLARDARVRERPAPPPDESAHLVAIPQQTAEEM